ncbi:MAG: DUF805 domain-containing protein [Endomicrobium sp.]|jgi:uncharacterized membrane protein YhaH (DUF805 family)|nr:DUF805 domain-containing protein [Endomicrobium sp.]
MEKFLLDNFWIVVSKHYADFNGKAARKQFWFFVLIVVVGSFLLSAFAAFVSFAVNANIGLILNVIYWVISLALIIPEIAIATRRLHDTDRRGWWQLIAYIPGLFLGVFSLALVGIYAAKTIQRFEEIDLNVPVVIYMSYGLGFLAVLTLIGSIVLIVLLALKGKDRTRWDN